MRLRPSLLTLFAGLGGAASIALAGPAIDHRALLVPPPGYSPVRRAHVHDLLREAESLLSPLLAARGSPALELVTPGSSETLPVDATLRADFEHARLVALDLELDQDRERMLVHEAAKLHARSALGERLPPWLEEGLACCVEDAWSQSTRLGLERADSDRSARARDELHGGRPYLERLRGLDAASFEHGERVHRDVALAWATVRHLIRSERGRRALATSFETLERTGDPATAERTLEGVYPTGQLEAQVFAGLR
jgi:hypothetical protein